MARPRKEIDPKQVELLAGVFCTTQEIATSLGCSKDTLERRFAASLEKGREAAKASLRRNQFILSKKNAIMAIWLGKQYLGQREPKVEVDVTTLDAAIERQLARLADRSQTEVSGEADSESVH